MFQLSTSTALFLLLACSRIYGADLLNRTSGEKKLPLEMLCSLCHVALLAFHFLNGLNCNSAFKFSTFSSATFTVWQPPDWLHVWTNPVTSTTNKNDELRYGGALRQWAKPLESNLGWGTESCKDCLLLLCHANYSQHLIFLCLAAWCHTTSQKAIFRASWVLAIEYWLFSFLHSARLARAVWGSRSDKPSLWLVDLKVKRKCARKYRV